MIHKDGQSMRHKVKDGKRILRKLWVPAGCFAMLAGALGGCGSSGNSPAGAQTSAGSSGSASGASRGVETIQLSLWGDERSVPFLEEAISDFQELHADEVKLEYTISMEGEDTCKETVLADPEHAADIFAFADDQFDELYQAGTLLEITENVEEVLQAVGGRNSGAAAVVTHDGKVYAYPETAGNGYFLYYNKAYFSDSDVQTLDQILDVATEHEKKFTMDYSNGWYIYSFFQGAGLTLIRNEDGVTNTCNWNATDTKYTGVDVAEAMLRIAEHPGFVSLGDDAFVQGVQSGEIIAGINGAWNAGYVEEAWGEDYAAVKLPTYTLAGEQVQMCSFAGYKLLGISAYTDYPEWSMKLAEYLTNEENQIRRFEQIGEGPVNVVAAQSEEVLQAPAIAALAEQSVYGNVQRVANPFWDAASRFGITIAGKNSGNRDLQELLDEMTAEITKPAEE